RLPSDDAPADFAPPGPPVLPGTYTVRIRRGDQQVSGTVVVRADPRFEISDADRRAKHDLLLLATDRQNVAVEAVDSSAAATKAVDRVKEQLKGKTDSASKALVKASDDLKQRLATVREVLVGPEGRQGLTDTEGAVVPSVSRVYGSLVSSWDAPTEA